MQLVIAGSGGALSPRTFGALRFSAAAGGLGIAQDTIINQTGNLIATGNNSIAMTVQSNAANGNGNVTAKILNPAANAFSLIVGGLGNGAGVQILDGATNTVENHGVVTAMQKKTGRPVHRLRRHQRHTLIRVEWSDGC